MFHVTFSVPPPLLPKQVTLCTAPERGFAAPKICFCTVAEGVQMADHSLPGYRLIYSV